jgi:hypothetical protein
VLDSIFSVITEETLTVFEIKEVLDEVGILKRLLEDQHKAVSDFALAIARFEHPPSKRDVLEMVNETRETVSSIDQHAIEAYNTVGIFGFAVVRRANFFR